MVTKRRFLLCILFSNTFDNVGIKLQITLATKQEKFNSVKYWLYNMDRQTNALGEGHIPF